MDADRSDGVHSEGPIGAGGGKAPPIGFTPNTSSFSLSKICLLYENLFEDVSF